MQHHYTRKENGGNLSDFGAIMILFCKHILGPPIVPFFGSLFFIPQIPGVLASCSKWFINK